MAPRCKEPSAFTSVANLKYSDLILAIGAKFDQGATHEDLRAFTTDCEAHIRSKWLKGTKCMKEVTESEQRAVALLEAWNKQHALSELERKLKAGADLIKLMRNDEQEPITIRKREQELIEEIEGFASLAKKLKKEHKEES